MAQPSAADATEIQALSDELQAQIDLGLKALASSDCGAACAALDAMRRAAQKICELDGGAPCVRARDRVASAEQRVVDACGDCATGASEQANKGRLEKSKDPVAPQHAPPEQASPDGTSPVAKPAEREAEVDAEPSSDPAGPPAAGAPPAQSKRGGCAGCHVAGDARDDHARLMLSLALLGAVYMRRRRR
jgi:hypothetical protein